MLTRYRTEQKIRDGGVRWSPRLTECVQLNGLKSENPGPTWKARLPCAPGERALDEQQTREPNWPVCNFSEFIKESVLSRISFWRTMELEVDVVDGSRMRFNVTCRASLDFKGESLRGNERVVHVRLSPLLTSH